MKWINFLSLLFAMPYENSKIVTLNKIVSFFLYSILSVSIFTFQIIYSSDQTSFDQTEEKLINIDIALSKNQILDLISERLVTKSTIPSLSIAIPANFPHFKRFHNKFQRDT